MKKTNIDVLIIGSGFGAAPAAKRLAEAGCTVTVVEKGPRIDPMKDFRQTQDPQYLLKYLKGTSGNGVSTTQAEALGGGSGFYEMVSLRAPSMAFRQTDENGNRLWPTRLTRQTLDPYYDIAESMLNVEQIAPEFVPKNGQLFSLLMRNLGYSCERARYAVRGCLGSGFCVTGCIYGAKQSLLLNYIPQAEAAGAVIATDMEATTIKPLRRLVARGDLSAVPARFEVTCRKTTDGHKEKFRCKILVLAGGTIGTTKLLLRSRDNLTALSPTLGTGISFNGGVKVAGLLPDNMPDGDMFSGRSHPGMISYEFLDSHGVTIAAAKPLPLQVIVTARVRRENELRSPSFWGAAHVDLMKRYPTRMMVLGALGLTPPAAKLTMTGRDDFHLTLNHSATIRRYHDTTKELMHSILRRNGCEIINADFVDHEGAPRSERHFSTAHQMGGAMMADSVTQGVCDAGGEVFGYPGMYVTDGAAIPSALAVNTSLTILANAERVTDELLLQYGLNTPASSAVSSATADAVPIPSI